MNVMVGSDGSVVKLFSLAEGNPVPVLSIPIEEALEVADMLQKLAQPKKPQPVVWQPVSDPTPWVKPRSPWGPPCDPDRPWGEPPGKITYDSKGQPKVDSTFLPPSKKDMGSLESALASMSEQERKSTLDYLQQTHVSQVDTRDGDSPSVVQMNPCYSD